MTAPPAFSYTGPTAVDDMIKLCTTLSGATALPEGLAGSPADLLLRMVAAQGLDIPFFTALRSLYPGTNPENGKASGLEMNAALQHALARRAGYTVQVISSDDTGCALQLSANGPDGTSALIGDNYYGREDAENSGVAERNPWWYQNFPAEMLAARAMTGLLGDYLPEVVMGLTATPGAYSAPAPAPVAAPVPAAGSPLLADLDAATDQYDPRADHTAPLYTPINDMRPDNAARVARELADATDAIATALQSSATANPTDPTLGTAVGAMVLKNRWAQHRAAVAEQRAAAYANAPAAEVLVMPAPTTRPAAPIVPGQLPKRQRQATAPAQDAAPADAPAPNTPLVPKVVPITAPDADAPAAQQPAAPVAPARRPRRTRATKEALELADQANAEGRNGVPMGALPEDAPATIAARALLARAATAQTPKDLGAIYLEATDANLTSVPLDGKTLDQHLMGRGRELQQKPKADKTKAAAPMAADTPAADPAPAKGTRSRAELGPCTCGGVQLLENNGHHLPGCPETRTS